MSQVRFNRIGVLQTPQLAARAHVVSWQAMQQIPFEQYETPSLYDTTQTGNLQ